MLGLVLVSLLLFALVAIFFPHVQGVLLVGGMFALPALFHYFVWGKWMSRMRERMLLEEEERQAAERRATPARPGAPAGMAGRVVAPPTNDD